MARDRTRNDMDEKELAAQMGNVIEHMKNLAEKGFNPTQKYGFIWGIAWTALRLKEIFPDAGFADIETRGFAVFNQAIKAGGNCDKE